MQGADGTDATVMDEDDAYTRATTRQRRRKGAIDFESENRADIEKMLYRRMTDEEEKDGGAGGEMARWGLLVRRSGEPQRASI